MCGIAGILNLSGKQLDLPRHLKAMTSAINHRGPDGEGFTFFSKNILAAGSEDTPSSVFESDFSYSPKQKIDSVKDEYPLALGHRRLAILDLSPAGHQPYGTPEGDIWITYNGEVYNYIEIRAELEAKGHRFFTGTDTEVIVAAYRQWGVQCLEKFNGMWAFVIYDHRSRKLFGARDRFGVKPLYYYKDKNLFAFASEQKALLKAPRIETGINPAAVFDFFSKGEIEYETEGMFKNILELFPSHAFTLNLDDSELKLWKYYALQVDQSKEAFDTIKEKEIVSRTHELLLNSVSLRLRSDVPVGSCLSGGLDSSAIVGMMRNLLGEKNTLDVFTASFKEKDIDESKWAKMVVDKTNANWHRTFPEANELMKDLQNLIYCQDVPIWSTSTYAQYRVMQLAKQNNTKVVLDGQGGDELFAGYDTYYLARWNELFKQGKFGGAVAEMREAGKGLAFFMKQQLRFYGMKKIPARWKSNLMKSYFSDIGYLNKDFWNEQSHRLGKPDELKTDSLNNMLSSEFVDTRLKGYLKCEDRCSMWHSVESRTPFADDLPLIEYLFQTPGAYKMHLGQSKYLLRKAAKGYLPSAIAERTDKMGYATPNNKWISELKEQIRPIFTSDLKEFINVDKLLKDYSSFFGIENQVENGRAFKFISFATWKKAFAL